MRDWVRLVLCVSALSGLVGPAGARELTITTIKDEPYVMSEGQQLEGYCIDLISELSKKLGFSYNVQLVKDNRYGALDSSGSWTGMIGEIIRGEADLAVAPLTATSMREQVVDMSLPFIHTGLSFVMRSDPDSEGGSFGLLAPFSAQTWGGVLIAFLGTGLCMFLVSRISPAQWAEPQEDEQSFTLLHSFWYITGALTLQGAGPHPRAPSGRLVGASWWLFVLLLLGCYFSGLVGLLGGGGLLGGRGGPPISSFRQLADQDAVEYGTVEAGSSMQFFKNSRDPVFRRLFQQMQRRGSFVSSLEEGVRRARGGRFAFIGEAVSLDLAAARHCELTRAPEVVSMRAYSVAAPLGSPLVKNLSIAILELSESGELTHLREKWWASSCRDPGGAPVGGGQRFSRALDPQQLQGLFLFLGLGLAAGLLLALLELLGRARHRARDGKRSCCSALGAELQQRFSSRPEEAEDLNPDKNKA